MMTDIDEWRPFFIGCARKLFTSFWIKHWLCNYQWYRRWYGGRWEYHWIDICYKAMWLDMRPDRCWPDWIQPCSHGTPLIEDYPIK